LVPVTLVAGVDSSTQSVKVAVHDAETGALVRMSRAPHPEGTECEPADWWAALLEAGTGVLDGVAAVAVAGQQHGMVTLDDEGQPVRPAVLWNDTRSAPDAADLVAELGGPLAWAEAAGSVPVASFTVTKLRWLARVEPDNAARVASVLLPHDWLTWQLCGASLPGAAGRTVRDQVGPTSDRGDASGTGYWSPATGEYRLDLLERAFGRSLAVPAVRGPDAVVGSTRQGALVAVGTGDNMAAALGVGLGPGDVAVSLGTSGTAFAVSQAPVADPTGLVAGFADATGRFLPLSCTLNAARVLGAGAHLLGVDLDRLSDLALTAASGAGGLVLLPYLDGERTPNLPDATGSLHGITRSNLTPANLARAVVEGMLCGLADAVDALVATGVEPRRVVLLGGAAVSPAVRTVAAELFGRPALVPPEAEYVARGAARQAAWALSGQAEPPVWAHSDAVLVEADPQPAVRVAYERVRGAVYPGSGVVVGP
jgi:xylulokinase